jgi:hypothetical protein
MANLNIKVPVNYKLLTDVHMLEVYYCEFCEKVSKHLFCIEVGNNDKGVTSYIPLCDDCKQRYEDKYGKH